MTITLLKHGLIPALVLVLASGCSKHEEADAQDAHAGHAHAKAAAAQKDACCPADAHTEAGHSAEEGKQCEHAVALSECGICKPDLIGALKPGEGLKVRLAGKESAAIVGVETAAAAVGQITDAVSCYAEITFNQNKLTQVAAPVGGIIQEVFVDLGSKVAEKQPVAKIWSASIAEAIARAVLSHQTLDRERKLRADRITSEKDLQQAEADHRSACQQLRTLGFTEEQIDELGTKPQEKVLLEVSAPFEGEVIERAAVRGALVEAGKPLVTLADRSVMWAMLNIPEAALDKVRLGQPVELEVESLPGRTFTGKLTWMSAEVDERTRMARARAEVQNPDGLLRSRMFAQARILVRSEKRAVVVPTSAVQQVDGKPFIFVKLEDDLFVARRVQTGANAGGRQEILEGVKPEEVIVSNHGFSLKSALLISRLGAGCADD